MGMMADLATRLNAATTITNITGAQIALYEFGRGDSGGQIAINKVTPGREWTHSGPDWLDRPRVRFDLRHTNPDTLETLAAALIAEMETASTDGTTKFHPAQLEADRTIDLGEQDGGITLFQRQVEFMFYHEETA